MYFLGVNGRALGTAAHSQPRALPIPDGLQNSIEQGGGTPPPSGAGGAPAPAMPPAPGGAPSAAAGPAPGGAPV
jgi:hypothetical protein